MRWAVIPVLAVLAASAGAADGEIYTWKDKSGQVHYSDTPPSGNTPTRTFGNRPAAKAPRASAVTETPATGASPASTSPGTAPATAPAAEASANANGAKPGAPAAPKASSSVAEQEVEFRKRRAEAAEKEEKEAKSKAEAEQKNQACQRAKNYLTGLESGVRVARLNEKGEREFLEDAQRAQEVESARKSVEANCK